MTLGTFDGRGDEQYVIYWQRRLRLAQGMLNDPLTRNIDAEHIAATGISLAERSYFDEAFQQSINRVLSRRTGAVGRGNSTPGSAVLS